MTEMVTEEEKAGEGDGGGKVAVTVKVTEVMVEMDAAVMEPEVDLEMEVVKVGVDLVTEVVALVVGSGERGWRRSGAKGGGLGGNGSGVDDPFVPLPFVKVNFSCIGEMPAMIQTILPSLFCKEKDLRIHHGQSSLRTTLLKHSNHMVLEHT